MNGSCDRCENSGKLYYTFGDYICQECLDKQSTDRDGHSGMVKKDYDIEDFYEYGLKGINLIQVKKSNPFFVDLFFQHYPDSKGIIGRQLNYLIYFDNKPIGAIGFASPIYNYNKFMDYFDYNDPERLSKVTLHNNIYRLNKNKNNLATRVLKKARETVFHDYYNFYDETLIGLETFVEPPRDGTVYQADNWDYLGKSEGISVQRRGDDWKQKSYKNTKQKHVYAKFLKSSYKNQFKHDLLYKSHKIKIRGKYSRLKWLSKIDGIGESRAESILSSYKFENFFRLTKEDYKKIEGIGAKTALKIKESLPVVLRKSIDKSERPENKNYLQSLLMLCH